MALISRITRAFTPLTVYSARPAPLPAPQWEPAPDRDLYGLLRAYYYSTDLYDAINYAVARQGIRREGLKPLRNPANRVVEFYAATLWPGPLDEALRIDDAASDAVTAAIQQVWGWSNWAARKQVAARWLAMLGDLFIKVTARDDGSRVYFQLIEPDYVTDFDTDERGYLTYIRVDMPVTERTGDKPRRVTHTEVWDKARDSYRLWVHDKPDGEELARLGTPREERALQDFGFDFVPFVHAKFRDVGQARGQAPIAPALDKITEADRMATRLHQMLFRNNKATWALRANGVDATGRPLPPPSVAGATANRDVDPNVLSLGDDEFYRLPGTSELQALVPDIKYGDALEILNAHLLELRRDLPELVYDELPQFGDQSGVALRLRLTGAGDRVKEARGNGLSAIQRADEMALTIGTALGLWDVGTYEAGDFAHTLTPPPIIQETDQEREAGRQVRATTANLLSDVLAPRDQLAYVMPEWTDQELAEALARHAAETPPALRAIDQQLGQQARQMMAAPPDTGVATNA